LVFPLILPLPALRHSSQIRWLLFYSGGNSQANNFEAWGLSMKRTLTALTIAATMFASSASAFDPDDLQKLRDTGRCTSCELSYADLQIAGLKNAQLHFANLKGANLGNAELKNANLSNADLRGAILAWAFLIDANLAGANLEGSYLMDAMLGMSGLCPKLQCSLNPSHSKS
jgi:uncharacterized protein YjbI with pentapeptide repeats